MSLFLITGASGSGKTTLAREVGKWVDWAECVSHTTRKQRINEEDGKEYYFISKSKFKEMKGQW